MQSTNSEYGLPYLATCHITFTFIFKSGHSVSHSASPLHAGRFNTAVLICFVLFCSLLSCQCVCGGAAVTRPSLDSNLQLLLVV